MIGFVVFIYLTAFVVTYSTDLSRLLGKIALIIFLPLVPIIWGIMNWNKQRALSITIIILGILFCTACVFTLMIPN